MSLPQRLKHEIRSVTEAAVFFGCWIAAFILMKQLLLAEYQIAFHGLALALLGALVLSKVVLVLEHVPLGRWVRERPAWVDVVVRTALYGFGVAVVLLFEKAFEGRREHGGFGPALMALLQHQDIHHVWANSIGLSGAILAYNVLTVVRRNLGHGALLRMFLSPLPSERCSINLGESTVGMVVDSPEPDPIVAAARRQAERGPIGVLPAPSPTPPTR